MNNDDLNLSLKAKLEQLFEQYKGVLQMPEQRSILEKGFVFSSIDRTADVLVMGINPSERTNFVNEDGISYDYPVLKNDSYFKKFHQLLSPYRHSITYCDLFYHKHSEQKKLNYFLKDELGKRFLKEQLLITKELITSVAPKLILVCNRKAATFFTTEWLGFKVNTEIKNAPFNYSEITELNVIAALDSYIYFSTFLGYRTKPAAIKKVEEEIPKLFNLLRDHL